MNLDDIRLDRLPEALNLSELTLSSWIPAEFARALEKFAGNVHYAKRRLNELNLDGWADPDLIDLLGLRPASPLLLKYYSEKNIVPECSRTSAHTDSRIRIELAPIDPDPAWITSSFIDTRFAGSLPPKRLPGMEIPGKIHVYRWYCFGGHALKANVPEGDMDILLSDDFHHPIPPVVNVYTPFTSETTSRTRRFEIMGSILEFLRLASASDDWPAYRNVRTVQFSDIAIGAIANWRPDLVVRPTPSYYTPQNS